jgi:hypothetical protein
MTDRNAMTGPAEPWGPQPVARPGALAHPCPGGIDRGLRSDRDAAAPPPAGSLCDELYEGRHYPSRVTDAARD